MERECTWTECHEKLTYCGRGRPPKYCAEHAAESKRELDRARPKGGHERKRYPQCCLDARTAEVDRWVCRQHQQWAAFRRIDVYHAIQRRLENGDGLSAEIEMPNGEIWVEQVKNYIDDDNGKEVNAGFRLSWRSPDEYRTWEEKAIYTEEGTWFGYRAKLEGMARQVLAGKRVTVPSGIWRFPGFDALYADSSARNNPHYGEGQYVLAA